MKPRYGNAILRPNDVGSGIAGTESSPVSFNEWPDHKEAVITDAVR